MFRNSSLPEKVFFFGAVLMNVMLAIAVFSGLSDKQLYTYFNSDTLYLPSVYKDLFIDKSGFAGWHLNGAPNFLPDMLLFFIVRIFFSKFTTACLVYSMLQLVIVLFLLSWLYKSILEQIRLKHISAAILLMGMFLLVTLLDNDFVYTFYLFSISYHMGTFMMCLLAAIFAFRYIKNGEKTILYWLFALITIATICDRLFLVLFSLPVLSWVVMLFFKQDDRKKILWLLLVNISAAALGLFLFRMVRLSGYIHIISLSWKVFNFDNVASSLSIFLEQHTSYLKSFGVRGLINILFILSLIIHIVLLVRNIYRLLKAKPVNSYSKIYYLLFFVAFSIIVLLTPVVNGSYVGWAILRYNIYALYWGIFSWGYLFYTFFRRTKNRFLYLSQGVVILLFLVASIISFAKNPPGKGLKKLINHYPDKVKCIDEFSRMKNVHYGIAEYWNAKYITMFSRENVRVYTVFNNLAPWYHVSNENWYYVDGKGKYGNPEFEFVIADKLDKQKIMERLGEPIDSVICLDDIKVYKFEPFGFNRETRQPEKKE